MNDRYGVDPCAAKSVFELASLLRQFGPEHGRFIFDFPPNWYAHVRDHFQDAGDLKRAQLIELWRHTAKRSLLPTKVRYAAAVAWVKNAEYLMNARGLIGPTGSRPPCRALEDVLIDHKALPDCRSGHLPRTPTAYAEAARPLLQISSKVVLIDPYFCLRYRPKDSQEVRPSPRHVRALTALLQAAQAERKVEVFKLMVSPEKAMIDDDDGSVFEADLDAILSNIGVTGITIEYGDLDGKHSLDGHPRYLLGNECGLKFDWGFDTATVKKQDSTQHVEWIGGAALIPLLDRFM